MRMVGIEIHLSVPCAKAGLLRFARNDALGAIANGRKDP